MSFLESNDRDGLHSTAKTILLAAAVAISLAAIAGLGSAATTEMYNDSVSFDNSSNVSVSIDWNSSISDPTNTTADVTFYNQSEYNTDPANATVVVSDTIASDPGNTTTVNYTETDGLVDGTDYQLIVTADDTAADSIEVDDGSSGIGFITTGSGGGALLGLAVLAAGAWYVRKED